MIYIHIPFCRSFCTYCDFYSEIVPGDDEFGRYADSLLSEIEKRRAEIEATLGTNTLYIGGGTPSVLPLDILRRITAALPYGPYDEFTVEANPDDIVRRGPGYVEGLLELGVNRISMGVQSLSDTILEWMNRRHDSDAARRALSILRESGVSNISADVIFGLSQLDNLTLEQTLDGILQSRPEHISAYQLSIEEGSALCRMVQQGRYSEASDEQCRSQYELICSRLEAAGYHHYEISNWALPGREAVHNSAYWSRQPYVGLGPGAHSLQGSNVRSWNSEQLYGWSTAGQETLSEEEIREETLMLGLRTDRGADGMVIPQKDWFVSDGIIADIISRRS